MEFENIFKAPTPRDGLFTTDEKGKPVNGPLHEELLASIDDAEFRKDSYERSKALGASKELLALLK